MKEKFSSQRWLWLILTLILPVCIGRTSNAVTVPMIMPEPLPTPPPVQRTRVGACTLAGSWEQTAEDVGKSVWDIDEAGKATENGLGAATGTATLVGHTLRIDWNTANGWSGYYEWQLDSTCNSGQGQLVFFTGGSGTRKTTVTRQSTANVSTPIPNPTPMRPNDSGNGASVNTTVNEPDHSPDKLDFCDVYYMDSSTRVLRFTASASGDVRAAIPPGLFRVSEIRRLGPLKSGKDTSPQLKGTPQDTKGRVAFQEGMPGPWTAHADPGDEVRIYVVFRPKSVPDGEKSATMKVEGPGPKASWAFSVPMRGMVVGGWSEAEAPPRPVRGEEKNATPPTKPPF